MPTYQQNKVHIYNWVRKNPERNRELTKLRKRRYDLFKKEQMRLFKILIDDNSMQ